MLTKPIYSRTALCGGLMDINDCHLLMCLLSLCYLNTQNQIKYFVQLQLLLTEKVMFGIPIVVQVDTQSYGAYNIANITVPSLEEGKYSSVRKTKPQLLSTNLMHFLLL